MLTEKKRFGVERKFVNEIHHTVTPIDITQCSCKKGGKKMIFDSLQISYFPPWHTFSFRGFICQKSHDIFPTCLCHYVIGQANKWSPHRKWRMLWHRSLNIWKSIYSLQEEIFVQQGASFVSFPVTKPVVTQGTTGYQMKDMDIIFPLIPLSFLWVLWFVY